MQLLIIEDHLGMCELIADAARSYVKDVHQFASAEEVLQRWANYTPRCATVDWRLLEMDGVEAIGHLRAVYPSIHLIMFTQFDEPRLRERALAAGADEFICKDRITELMQSLQRIFT
jgi:two-component system, OmpR family, response regulator